MYLARVHILIVLVLKLLSFGAGTPDGQNACSCYTFENDLRMAWQQAKNSCEFHKKHLVVMETEREWEFINDEIKNQTTFDNEWHIGLFLISTTGNWTWINGKPLTVNKWQPDKPDNDKMNKYALIAKEWPPNKGYYGSFNSIRSDIQRAWICEEETDNCSQGVCMFHDPVTTTKANLPSTTVTAETTKNEKDLQDSTTVASTPDVGGRKDDKSDSTVVIVAASLAAVLFIALIILAVVFFLKRKRQQPQDAERPKKQALKQPENPYESINPTEAANLLGTPKSGSTRPKTEQAEYAMVNKEKMKQKKGNPVCETKQAPPETDHEYAVVNKENKKQKKGDLVYAKLDMGEFDDAEDDPNLHKPAPYEHTVYADVVPTEVINRVDPGSTTSAYENVQTTGV